MYFTVPCAGLEAMGLLENTVSIFTSDNGYHLGEHRLKFGKSEPYETDIRLPFFVAGVGVAKGQRRAHPTNHIDIGASLVDLAQASAHVPVGSFSICVTELRQRHVYREVRLGIGVDKYV
eukprot:m.373345 g.373345  ORF g.373345 m.373345 type:complete len:120 (+) comp20885_c0_seq16:113-472(+)